MFRQSLRSLPAVAVLGGVVLLAASGGAVAGTMITGAQIKNGTVASPDLKDGGVTSLDLKDKTVKPADLAPATVQSLQRVGGYQRVNAQVQVAPADNGQVAAQCPSGTQVLGVAAHWVTSFAAAQTLINPANTVGISFATNNLATPDTLVVDVTCGRVVA